MVKSHIVRYSYITGVLVQTLVVFFHLLIIIIGSYIIFCIILLYKDNMGIKYKHTTFSFHILEICSIKIYKPDMCIYLSFVFHFGS